MVTTTSNSTVLTSEACSLTFWWVKRDARLTDNPALIHALSLGTGVVIPLVILEPHFFSANETSSFHRAAILDSVISLRKSLARIGGALLAFEQEVITTFEYILQKTKRFRLVSHQETGTELTYARDRAVKRWCKVNGIVWDELPQNGVIRCLDSRDNREAIWRQRMSSPILKPPSFISNRAAVERLASDLSNHAVRPITKGRWIELEAERDLLFSTYSLQRVHESAAHQTLESFLSDRVRFYSGGISAPELATVHGSRLSPHLAWGTISLRVLYQATLAQLNYIKESGTYFSSYESKRWQHSLRAFLSRLHWRDHFIQRLECEPQMEFKPLSKVFDDLPYITENNPLFNARLMAWVHGMTGVPMVDACMRALRETGFLNFRMRAMLVSYACHVLHLSWRSILNPFARVFYDFEPGIHISQVQMQAGVVGINTVRLYSPDKQLQDHDPKCSFVYKWCPELRDISPSRLAKHASLQVVNYPSPLVEYATSSKRMISEIYKRKKSALGFEIAKEVYRRHGSRSKKSVK